MELVSINGTRIDNYSNFNLKYATIVTYLNIIKVHLKQKLGLYKLSQIDSGLIQNFINHNPVEHVYIPRYEVVTSNPAHIYTQEEIERILNRFKDLPYIYYSFLTTYYTGL